jgi:Uma2 family endonuclease
MQAYTFRMVSAAPGRRVTYTEYAAGEDQSLSKHDYVRGEVFAMAGGTPEHAALVLAVGGLLFAQLRGKPCRAYSADLRIRIRAVDAATYPDVTVVCGEAVRDDEDPNSVLNPTVIIEVLSDGTERYDRGDKFAHYRQIPSLREYVLISQHARMIERHVRNDNASWTMTAFGAGTVAELAAIGCRLDVDAIYEGLTLKPPPPPREDADRR